MNSNEVVIRIKVSGLPVQKIYLTEAHYWNVFLDSATVKNGEFLFRLNRKGNYEPFMTSICYWDSAGKIEQLSFLNPFRRYKNGNIISSSFFPEQGRETLISGIYKPGMRLSISSGRQTEAYFKMQMTSPGNIGEDDSNERSTALEKLKANILNYPYSYFILWEIFENKEQYKDEEINSLLPLFTKELQSSALAQRLKDFQAYRLKPGQAAPNLLLPSAASGNLTLYDSTARVNMLVFWASWCAPCRMEIPDLKELRTKFSEKDLHISSISLDEKEEMWRSALAIEKMNWNQLLVAAAEIKNVKARFNFDALPTTIFLNGKGIELFRITGFDPGKKGAYPLIVQELLNQPAR